MPLLLLLIMCSTKQYIDFEPYRARLLRRPSWPGISESKKPVAWRARCFLPCFIIRIYRPLSTENCAGEGGRSRTRTAGTPTGNLDRNRSRPYKEDGAPVKRYSKSTCTDFAASEAREHFLRQSQGKSRPYLVCFSALGPRYIG